MSIENHVDLDLASGLYMLKVVSENHSVVKKIIVK